jgi:isoquinoline 1-oxidoreductase beta subunit
VSHNGEVLLRRPGITHVLPLENGVAIVGERIEAVLAARQALNVQWSPGAGAAHDSDAALTSFLEAARDPGVAAVTTARTGEAAAAIAAAPRTHSAEFTTDYVYHAQMEPLACVASVSAGAVEIWVGTQWPSQVRDEAARLTGLPAAQVKVNMLPMGGGFGRRAHIDYAIEAVRIAQATGRPVKVMATREDDMANAHVRPMTAHRIDVGLDADGGCWLAPPLRRRPGGARPLRPGAARRAAGRGPHRGLPRQRVSYDVPAHLPSTCIATTACGRRRGAASAPARTPSPSRR